MLMRTLSIVLGKAIPEKAPPNVCDIKEAFLPPVASTPQGVPESAGQPGLAPRYVADSEKYVTRCLGLHRVRVKSHRAAVAAQGVPQHAGQLALPVGHVGLPAGQRIDRLLQEGQRLVDAVGLLHEWTDTGLVYRPQAHRPLTAKLEAAVLCGALTGPRRVLFWAAGQAAMAVCPGVTSTAGQAII